MIHRIMSKKRTKTPPDDVEPVHREGIREKAVERRARAKETAPRRKRMPTTTKTSATSPSRLLMKEKQRQALELRMGGATYAQIAQVLGYANSSGPKRLLDKAMQATIQEPVEQLRMIQIERLNRLLLACWTRAAAGDDSAMARAQSIMRDINAISGLNEPSVTATVNNIVAANSTGVLVVEGDQDDFVASMKRMIGFNPDGTNANPPAALTAAPEGILGDVVDGEVVEDVPIAPERDEPRPVPVLESEDDDWTV